MRHVSLSAGLRLAVFFAIATTTILLVLHLVVSGQVSSQFNHTVRVYQLEQRLENGERIPLGEVIRGSGFVRPTGNPAEFFKREFSSILFWVTFAGIIFSMLLGYVLAYFFVSLPLRKLRLAVEKLKAREVHDDLPPTGVREFDQLIEDFNGLAGELNRVESLRQNLISDTSHELKTPISALRVQLEGIKDGVVVLDKKRAEVLLNQVDRLSELTETLQEYARLRSKAATLKKKSVEIQSIIEAALEEQKTSLEIAKLEVEVLVTEGATILADKHLATQLVSNVIANACRHSQATKLTITANEKECSIVDNGKGVPEHSLKDLFERFYRVDGSRNRKEAGLGLGLAIVKEICHAHGWSCVAENADPGLEITITF